MEFYLVKDFVEVINLEKFRKNDRKREGFDQLLIYFPVCFPYEVRPGDQSESSREFSGIFRELMKDREEEDEWNFAVLLTLDSSERQNYLLGYIVLENDDILKREAGEIFTDENFLFSVILTLCHLPTENTPASPENSFILRKSFGPVVSQFVSYEKEEVAAVKHLWDQETGFISATLTVLGTVNQKAVNVVMRGQDEKLNSIVDLNRKMLVEEICTNLEIICGDGKIVKCHRAVLSGRIKAFQDMFQTGEMKEARMGTLVMENMSEEGVKAFLGWIYWNDEKPALLSSDVAVELLIAGDKYDLEELVEGMEEIIFERRGYDEEWFSVDSAVNLFRWTSLKEMEYLRKHARDVLQFFGKTFPEKLVESEEYQELIKNDAGVALELAKN